MAFNPNKDISDTNALPVSSAPLAEINDTSGSTYYYFCEAQPGTASSAAAWRISRLTIASGVLQWADGNANFDNVADNRAALAYS